MSRLRTVLVTGAGRGLGLAVLQRFAAAGWSAVGTVRSETAPPAGARLVRCDVRREDDVDALAARLRAECGSVDVLVNNAAIFEDPDYEQPADRLDPAMLARTLEVNVVALVRVTGAILPLVPAGGRVINLSSDLGQFAPGGMSPTMTAYAMSKAAVNAYTSALAAALRDREILVDSLHPGWLRTAMGGEQAPEDADAGAERVYALATRPPGETGRFWIAGAPAPW